VVPARIRAAVPVNARHDLSLSRRRYVLRLDRPLGS
jgi:hypothetical protein